MNVIKSLILLLCFNILVGSSYAQKGIDESIPSTKPSKYQKQQIKRKYGMFIHFEINTFHNQEWTDGSKPALSYNPTAIDARQWVETAKNTGMKHIILVAKHHEGFCLWDSKYTDYDVANSGNPTNVVKEVAKECKRQGYTGIPEAPQCNLQEDLGIAVLPDEKVNWMLDDKLGMFIHWGLYAGPAQGEWYMENNGIHADEYRKLAYPESGDLYFDAKEFDAKKWVHLAKKMGARYMNMVTQHHDGYALFESKYMNAFTSKQTHNRDFVKEYVEACREAGLKVGLYKTLINWRYPGYYDIYGEKIKDNKFGYVSRPENKEDARVMKEELYCQFKELLTNYGHIDQLFWDGGWLGQQGSDRDGAFFWESGKYMSDTSSWPVNPLFQDLEEETGRALGLMGMARKYQPDMAVNPRSGWVGDYRVDEGGGDVKGPIRTEITEKCLSLAPGWGYTTLTNDPARVMSLNRIKQIFADCMVRNMCFLVNIGPDRHGNVPPLIEQRIVEFGDWVGTVQEAVYGTRGGPWQPVDEEYGFTYKDNVVYIYFFGKQKDANFTLPPVDKDMKVTKAYIVGKTNTNIKTSQKGQNITLQGLQLPQGEITVVAVELNKNVR